MKKTCNNSFYPPGDINEILFPRNIPLSPTIQLTPQYVHIKTLPGRMVTFNLSYRPAKDYPLDVYYLIDNSYTMHEHTKKIAAEGKRIPKVLLVLSNNLLLGVGTFVEKPDLPYAM